MAAEKTNGEKLANKQSTDITSNRPQVLGVRFGVNPNSSSLGVDVTFLLFGGTAAVAASLVLSAWLRGWRRNTEVVAEPAAAVEE